MKKVGIGICVLIPLALYAAEPSATASADFGGHSRDTGVRGIVSFEDNDAGVRIRVDLNGLEAKDHSLSLVKGCPADDIQDRKGQMKQSMSNAQKLTTLKASTGGALETTIKGFTVKQGGNSVVSKGLLLSRGRDPIECAVILPPFGPPPGFGK